MASNLKENLITLKGAMNTMVYSLNSQGYLSPSKTNKNKIKETIKHHLGRSLTQLIANRWMLIITSAGETWHIKQKED